MWYKIKKIYLWTDLVRPPSRPTEPARVTAPGMYHNQTDWLVSMSADWVNWITLSDRDLWASSYWWAWNLFQRWNNYAFSRNATLTKSSTQVDASSYCPGNYYSSSTFITWGDRDSSGEKNLWWWQTLIPEQMRWPCAEWWHIPSSYERDYMMRIGSLYEAWTYAPWSAASSMSAEPIGLASNKWYYNTSWTWSTSYKYYWMADWWSSSPCAFWIVFSAWQLLSYNADECNWYAIRPFKDDPVVPTTDWTVISTGPAIWAVNFVTNTCRYTDSETGSVWGYMIPYTQYYTITCKWAWSSWAAWWLAQWTFFLHAWDVIYCMVWQNWGSVQDATKMAYWFGWKSTVVWWAWGWMSATHLRTDWKESARIDNNWWTTFLVVWWWAWWWNGWAWGWTTWWTPTSWSWTAWGWATQSWHWSWGNAWSKKHYGWDWSWTEWYWGWWGRYWGNGSIWSGSTPYIWGWGWSGYVHSSAINPVLIQWWWSAANTDGEISIVSIGL